MKKNLKKIISGAASATMLASQALAMTDAEIVAWDTFTAKPLLVRRRFGDGWVYTFTFWAYPGHEKFQTLSAAWVARLAEEARGETYAEDESGEVFWTVWEDGEKKSVMILNTDWTSKGNVKPITLVNKGKKLSIDVTERRAVIADIDGDNVTVNEFEL